LEQSLGWTLDILLNHLGDSHNIRADAEEVFKQEQILLPGMVNYFLERR
jgi:hypothetical protein